MVACGQAIDSQAPDQQIAARVRAIFLIASAHLDAYKSATSLGEGTGRRTQGLPRMLHGPSGGACSALERRERDPGPQPPAQAGHAILSRAESRVPTGPSRLRLARFAPNRARHRPA
jgi:hypothetical protein